jgi:trimeric autotransporter adhesin
LPARRGAVFIDAVSVEGTFYVTAEDGTHGRELWKSDGTRDGTRMVANLSKRGNSTPRWLTRVNDRLFFSAYRPGTGRELWKSNGTANGTTLIRDIWR